MPVATIEAALEDIRAGKMVILVDDEDRENEGDLTMAAEKVTPEAVNFMASYGRGLICLSLTPERIEQLATAHDGPGKHVALQDRLYDLHRGPPGGDHRHFGPGPGHNNPDRHRRRRPAGRPGQPRPCLPAAGPQGRGSGPHRPDRGFGGPGPPGRPEALRGHL